MVDFDNVLCDAFDLHDKDLIRLRDDINEEIQKREKQREQETIQNLRKALQDYFSAGYSIQVKGMATFWSEGFDHERGFETEVYDISDTGEIVLLVEGFELD